MSRGVRSKNEAVVRGTRQAAEKSTRKDTRGETQALTKEVHLGTVVGHDVLGDVSVVWA